MLVRDLGAVFGEDFIFYFVSGLEELIALVVQLRMANVALEDRVQRWERLVSCNSGNSSMPPSSDELPGRTNPAPKQAKASGRKRGKQQGAQGHALSWVSAPDEWVAHPSRGG